MGIDPRLRLRWVSVLHSVVPVRYETRLDESDTLAQVIAAAIEMRNRLRQVDRTASRRWGKNLWLKGGVHIELVDYQSFSLARLLGKSTAKEKTLEKLVEAGGATKSGKYFLVHFHALVDLNGIADGGFRDLLLSHWGLEARQVRVERLWKKIHFKGRQQAHSIDDALKGMARYCFNMSNARLEYSANWGAGSIVFEGGEEVSAAGHIEAFATEVMDRELCKPLSYGDIKLLVRAHDIINGSSHRGLAIAIY